MAKENARIQLAWLMWCYTQGYTKPEDRAILENWMGDDPDTLGPNDRETQQSFLAMADEILASISAEEFPTRAKNKPYNEDQQS